MCCNRSNSWSLLHLEKVKTFDKDDDEEGDDDGEGDDDDEEEEEEEGYSVNCISVQVANRREGNRKL